MEKSDLHSVRFYVTSIRIRDFHDAGGFRSDKTDLCHFIHFSEK